MTIMDSSIAKNSSDGARGVGIYNTATMTVIASTILGNSGGGIYSGQGDTATLGATIVADNTGGPNCVAYDAGSFYSVGYNSLATSSSGLPTALVVLDLAVVARW
jgi:hypothetical protein